MSNSLLAPDELGDLVDAPEFAAMPFAERQTVFEQGVQDASQWVRDNGGWTPDTWKGYGEAVGALRTKVKDSETFGETAGRYAGVVGQTLKDSAAMAGTTALDLGVVDPMTSWEAPDFKVPGSEVGTALARGTVKALDAGGSLLAQALSTRNNEVESRLATVKREIDDGKFPFEAKALGDWLQQHSDELEPHQSAWYQTAETLNEDAPAPEMQAWARANSLATPRHATQLARYMQTRDPKVWDSLTSDILRAPQAAQIQSEEEKQARDSTLGQFLDINFGDGAHRMITEAGDPFEWAGTLVPFFKGAKVVKKAGTIGRKALDIAEGVGAEMLSEQASLTADDPNASWEQRKQVAKDTLAGALGLTAAGAGIGMLGKRERGPDITPGEVVSSTAPNAPVSDSGVLAQMAETAPGSVVPASAGQETLAETGGAQVADARAGNQIDFNPPAETQTSSSNLEIPPEIPGGNLNGKTESQASVTPEAAPVAIPAAQVEAPVAPTTDAGSSPATGALDLSAPNGRVNTAQTEPGLTGDEAAMREGAAPQGQPEPSTATGSPEISPALQAHRARLLQKAAEYDQRRGVTVTDVTPPGYGPEQSDAQPDPTRLWADPAKIQGLRNTINEGRTLLKGKMEPGKRRGIEAAVARAEAELKKTLNFEPETNPRSSEGFKNLDTSGTTAGFLNTDIINEGVDLIRQGITDFVAWSKAMLTRFGEAIRDYLQGVWQAAVKNSQAGGSLPKGEKPADQRAFGKRVREDPRVSEGAKDHLGDPLEYDPISNAETLAGANAVIDQNGLEAAAGMVMDDAVKMTDAQRVTLGMQTMMRLDQQAREAMSAGDAATAARLYNLMTTVSEKTDKLGTALGQGVQAFAMWNRMTPEGALLQFEKRVRESNGGKMPRLPKELLGTLGKLRDQVNALPEGSVTRADKMRELLGELARYEGIPMGSVFMAYWYANLLSGVSTQGVNVWGNGLNLMARTLAAGLANHPADTLQMIRGMIRNWRMAAGEARAAWAGRGSAKGNTKYDVPTVEKYAQQNALELMLSGKVRDWKYWTTKVMTLGGALKYVFRALTAADAAFWHTAAEGRVHLAASRAARQGHTPGSAAYVQAMAEQLGDGKAKFAEALQQAADEMKAAKLPVTPAEQNRRAWQIVEQSRPMPAREEAHRFGDLTTFAQEPEGFAALIYGILQKAQNAKAFGVPVLRPFVPFARIVSNLFSQGLDWTPIGIARGIRGQHVFGSDKFAPWERKERAAAGVIGTTLAGLVASAAFSNKDDDDKDTKFMIYGMGPPDKAKRAQMPKGWKPYTIKVGNRYISYAETPLVFALAPVAAGLDKMRYGSQFNEASWGARSWYLMQGGGKALFSQGVLSSLGDLVGTMQGAVKPERLPAKFTSGAIPFSGLMRDLVPLFDPTKISDATIAASIFRDIPVVRGIAGKPSLNVFGEPVRAEGWQRVPVVKRFYDTAKNTDKDADFLARNKLWISGTPQHGELETGDYLTAQQKAAIGLPASNDRRAIQMARMQARLLTPEESYTWQKRAGELTRERITALRKESEGSLTPVEPEALQKRINAVVEVARRMAMSEMITKLR